MTTHAFSSSQKGEKKRSQGFENTLFDDSVENQRAELIEGFEDSPKKFQGSN